jgi:hypothetical protein
MRKFGLMGLVVAVGIVCAPVVAQAAALLQIIPGDGIIVMILNAALALALPVAGTYGFTELSKFVLKAQGWSAFAKRVLVFSWGTVMAGFNHALHLSLPEVFGVLSEPEIQLLFTTGLTYLAHQILNPRKK